MKSNPSLEESTKTITERCTAGIEISVPFGVVISETTTLIVSNLRRAK